MLEACTVGAHEEHGYTLIDGEVYPRCKHCLEAFNRETGKTIKPSHLAKKAA